MKARRAPCAKGSRSGALFSLLQLVVLVATLRHIANAQQAAPVPPFVPPAIRCGEFCSTEHVKSYVGPIDTAISLRAALDSLSFKREIIFAHHRELDHAYQALHRWQRFGYAHIMLVFPDRAPCERLRASGAFPTLGCGYYADHNTMTWITKQEGGCKGCTDKWVIHYTGARAVRMGYNVMVADADTMPLYDFYGLVKTPPYNNVSMFNQREGYYNVNGGFYYVQSAAPGGPVAYLLYDNILKNVRWYEDVSPLRVALGYAAGDGSQGLSDGYICNDQCSLSDAVHSAITGTPQFYECAFLYHKNRTAWTQLYLDIYARTGPKGGGPRGWGPYDNRLVAVPPPVRRGAGGAAEAEMVVAELRLPHARGVWPPERAGYPFQRELGPLARHVAGVFLEAGGAAPPFPDPADPAAAPAAAAVAPELWAYFPPWIANTHGFGPANKGDDGWYNDHLTGEMPAAVSHLHAGLAVGDHPKLVHLAVEVPYGWDYDLALRVEPTAAPYLATAAHGHVPPLLALAPGVAHARLTGAEYAALVQGLVRLALSLNRAVAWPWVPCEAPFLRREGATHDPAAQGHRIPWSDYINTSITIPHGAGTPSLRAGLPCLVCAASKLSCLRGGTRPGAPSSAPRGLMPHEFDHWLAAARKRGAASEAAAAAGAVVAGVDPAAANTVQDILQQHGGSVVAAALASGTPLLHLTAADLALLSSDPGASRAPVLWLRGPVSVPALPSPEHAKLYEQAASMCCALQDPPSRTCMDRPPWDQRVPS